MTASIAPPIVVTPEAAARVDQLGMKAQLESMLEHTCRTVPDLRRLRVVLEPPYDTGDEPYLTIEATRSAPYRPEDPVVCSWGAWKSTAFPAEVARHFALLVVYEAGDAR
jgi:hypothetical protein